MAWPQSKDYDVTISQIRTYAVQVRALDIATAEQAAITEFKHGDPLCTKISKPVVVKITERKS